MAVGAGGVQAACRASGAREAGIGAGFVSARPGESAPLSGRHPPRVDAAPSRQGPWWAPGRRPAPVLVPGGCGSETVRKGIEAARSGPSRAGLGFSPPVAAGLDSRQL